MTDPEGTDVIDYDALYRVKSVTRRVSGAADVVETYDYNALGALTKNAPETTAIALDDQRPRIGAAGTAPSAVMAKLNGAAVTVDPAGRITGLNGATIAFDSQNHLTAITANGVTETYWYDAYDRRVGREPSGGQAEYYVYEGANVVATVDATGGLKDTYLYDGVDSPLRLKRAGSYYFHELDLAGNVRRIRALNGADLGGYRYTAFGITKTADAGTPVASVDQPLRWKGRWYVDLAGGVYDVRARWWSPQIGSFLSVDEFRYHDPKSTLWAWPRQNPIRFSDPSGRSSLLLGGPPEAGGVLDVLLNGAIPAATSASEFGAAGGVISEVEAQQAIAGGRFSVDVGTELGLPPNAAAQDGWGLQGILPVAIGAVCSLATRSPRAGELLEMQLAAEAATGARIPKSITGYTAHGLDQAIARDGAGVSARAILDAWRSPLSVGGKVDALGRASFQIVGNDAMIVVNPAGQIVSVWARGLGGVRLSP